MAVPMMVYPLRSPELERERERERERETLSLNDYIYSSFLLAVHGEVPGISGTVQSESDRVS